MRLLTTGILAAFMLLAATHSRAHGRPPGQASQVAAELLADVSSIAPGQPFTLGVKFKIAPKWHIYWINPGESGEATHVKFDLPPGFAVGDLRFPAPRVIRLPGPIISYGYEQEVMLLATVTPPKDLPSGAMQKLVAHADWLECEDVCVPGEAKVALELPASDRATPANQEAFLTWARKIPIPIPMGPEHWVSSRPSGDGREYQLSTHWTKASKTIEFIPGPSDDVNFRDVDIQTKDDRTVIRFKVEPLKGRAMPEAPIPCVVSYSDPPSDSPAGVAFDIPMRDNPSTNPSGKR